MKKILISLLMALLSVFCLLGCRGEGGSTSSSEASSVNDSSQSTEDPSVWHDVIVNPDIEARMLYTYKQINCYEYFQLPFLTEETNITWASSDPSIVSVAADGTLLGKKGGNAYVKASVGGNSYVCEIAVKDSGYVPTVELDLVYGQVDLLVGAKYTLAPYLCLNMEVYNDAVFTYKTNSSIISIDQNGTITALSAGTAEVEIQAAWRNCPDILNCTISVVVA